MKESWDIIEKHMGLLGYDRESFDRFRRHMDRIMEETPCEAQKNVPKKQDQQRFRIPKINVKDIFGEVIMSELTRKRKTTEPCELPRKKKASVESSEHNDTELSNSAGSEDIVHSGEHEPENECTEEMEEQSDQVQQKRDTEDIPAAIIQDAEDSNEEQGKHRNNGRRS